MLRPEEIDRIKYQLGITPIRIGAEPYIAYVAIFDRVIQPYLYDNSSTLSTAVATAGTQVVTLASNPNSPGNALVASPTAAQLSFQLGTSCVIDVGPSQEIAAIQVLSGLQATLTFANAHPAGCQIMPNGEEQIVRAILARIDTIQAQIDGVAPVTAGVSALVGEVELSARSSGRTRTRDKAEVLFDQRHQARNDLARAVGYANLNPPPGSGGGGFSFEVY